jgi:DNA-binding transcriptional MerR regulator
MQNERPVLAFYDQQANKGEMTISDMARTYSVSLRTLRFYEDKDLLHPRRQGSARFYSADDRLRLELILKGKRLGFTLAEIFELIESREKAGATSAAEQSADLTVSLDAEQIASQIAHLKRQRAELDVAIEELMRAHERMSGAKSGSAVEIS